MNKSRAALFIAFLFIGIFLVPGQRGFMMAQAEQIRLPQPDKKGSLSLEETILRRRSHRTFSGNELTLSQIGQLLFSAQGITETIDGSDFRAAPSSGALYPMELYVLTPEGVFHYIPKGHFLEVKTKTDLRQALSGAALGQEAIQLAPMTIVISAVYSRVTGKYGQRGEQYTHMEAGHIAQNVHLQAVSLGLSSVPIGAFENKKVKSVLSLPPDQEPLYIISVGYAD